VLESEAFKKRMLERIAREIRFDGFGESFVSENGLCEPESVDLVDDLKVVENCLESRGFTSRKKYCNGEWGGDVSVVAGVKRKSGVLAAGKRV